VSNGREKGPLFEDTEARRVRQESPPGAPTTANKRQVGGTHYQQVTALGLQHWDLAALFHLDYFQGQVTKYLFRWRLKGGLQDLHKARHYLDKYLEVETACAMGVHAVGPAPNTTLCGARSVALDRQTIIQEEVTCPRCLGVLLRVHEELKEPGLNRTP
jgi:hypothetical protein